MFQLVALLYLSMGNCRASVDITISTNIPDIIGYLCPGSDVCSVNKSSDGSADDFVFNPGKRSCCDACSCSAECTNTRSCCFPKILPYKNELEVKLTDNGNSHTCFYPMFPQPTKEQHLYQSFLMVSSVNKTVKGHLEGHSNITCGDLNVAPWGSLYPVYSTKSKKLYKNIKCAQEDGVDTGAIVWDAVIYCRDASLVPGITLADNVFETKSVPEKCEISFIFPEDVGILQPLKCYTNLIDTCSKSTDFQVPEGINASKDDIRTLCRNSGIISPYRATKLYANVFCHICSGALYIRRKICNIIIGDKPSKSEAVRGFKALIDGNFISQIRNNNNEREQVLQSACLVENVDTCRHVLCPTGKLRDMTGKCLYPNKIWYNQHFAVFVNLTLDKPLNVSEVFKITNSRDYTTDLPPLKSKWLNKWSVTSIYYRVMDEPHMSNSFIIAVDRKLSTVKPDTIITNVRKMIGQAWSTNIRDVTKVMKSSDFSTLTSFWTDPYKNRFNNITEQVDMPRYEMIYARPTVFTKKLIVTRLYICDQVELASSEFVLSKSKNILYSYITKRFMFNGQFVLMHSGTQGESRARICIEESGLLKSNGGTVNDVAICYKALGHCSIVAGIVLILVHHLIS